MSAYAEIGQAEAIGVLAEAQAIGQLVRFWHRDDAPVDIYVIPTDITLGFEESQRGALRESNQMIFITPNQANFPAEITTTSKPVSKGDKFEMPIDSGRFFTVNSDSIPLKANGFVYYIPVTERCTNTLGVKS